MAALLTEGRAIWKYYQPFSFTKKDAPVKAFTTWANHRSEVAWSCLRGSHFEGEWERWCKDGDS